MKSGVAVLLAVAGGWVLTGTVSFYDEALAIRLGESDLPKTLLNLLVIVGSGLVVSGVGLLWRDERRSLSRQVTVVEVRGLRDVVTDSLEIAVRKVLRGQVIPLSIDLRQGLLDGEIVDPAASLIQLEVLPVQLAQRKSTASSGESVVVYGGLAPVPMTFLTGMLIDDEGSVIVFDWDRHRGRWRLLDAADDDQRFERKGMESIADGTAEVALAVSVSYRVRVDVVKGKVPGLPVVELSLPEVSSDRHWSEGKQIALGTQFFETAKALAGLGVERIHLFLGAPNSMVFKFGQLYDRRTLRALVVYQYDQRDASSYPWAVAMPASGQTRGELVK